ncbi:MFS transporter [Salana multivorans]
MFPEPTEPAPKTYTIGLVVAQFIFFIALLGPAIIGVSLKIVSIVENVGVDRQEAVALVSGIGAFGALVANVVFGRLSDRTTSRWGRRRPWIVAGTLVMTLGLAIMAFAPNVSLTAAGWFVAQLGANATLAPFIATISDQVPKFQRAQVSALVGIAQNLGILGGTWVAQLFQKNMFMMLVVPSFAAIAAMVVFAFLLRDQVLPVKPPRMSLRAWAETFWVSPVKYPDYALAWWSRFLITMASFMFSTYRFFFLNEQVGIPEDDVAGVITTSVFIYTAALVVTAWFAGKMSDMLQRRKIFVIVSTALYALGTALLATTHSVGMFYVVELVLGIAYGVYIGVDLALVVDVLPNPDDAGKDLGVFNMANALPQTLSPIVAGWIVVATALKDVDGTVIAADYKPMLMTAAVLCLAGAAVILPIKKVR